MDKPRFLRRREVERRTGYSSPQLFRLEAKGEFPARVKIGDRAVAWIESEVDDWILARVRAAGRVPAPPLPRARRAPAQAAAG